MEQTIFEIHPTFHHSLFKNPSLAILKMEYFNVPFIAHQVFWRPAFHVVHSYFMNAPKWAGGYGGLPQIDVCSMTSGISTNNLIRAAPELCEESIATLINGYTVLLITILTTLFLVLFVREIIPLVRQIIPAYYQRVDQLKKEKATKERNQLSAIKRAETVAFHSEIKAFAKTVITVLKTDGDAEDKVFLLMSAFQSLDSNTKSRLGEPDAKIMLENVDDLLKLK